MTFEQFLGVGNVGLVVLGVMNLHRLRIDVRFKRIASA